MSTTRKKKTETEKVSPLTDKGYYVSFDPALMGQYRRGRNPLDAALESEDAALAQELKSTRVEGILLKHKAKKAKLQKEIDKLEKESEKNEKEESALPGISISMARQIAMLSQEEQEKIMQTYAAFRSIDQSKGRGDSLLPLLIGFSKSNPGTQQSDMITYAKAMSDQFKTGIDAMKAVMPPKEKASNATELLKIFKDLVTDSVKNPMEKLVKNMQPQPSAFEQIIMNPEMRSAAKEMGMFGGRETTKGGSTNIDLEIEKLRGERELSIKKLDLEWRKSRLESDAKDRRSDNMMSFLAPLSAFVAGPVSQRMQSLGQQQGATHMPPSVNPNVMPPIGQTILLGCSCGYEGSETFPPGQLPDTIECPQCGLGLVVNVGKIPDGKTEHSPSSRPVSEGSDIQQGVDEK